VNNRDCFTCVHLSMTKQTLYGEYQNGQEWSREVSVFWCDKLNKLVYPPCVDNKGNDPYEFGDIINEPMPVKCDSKKDYQSLHQGK
jgi:hypothetical protein